MKSAEFLISTGFYNKVFGQPFFCIFYIYGVKQFMSDFIFRINPNIILGPYTVSRLGQQVREWGSRFMVIVDPFLNEAKVSEKIIQT